MAAILYKIVPALSSLYLNSDFLQIWICCSLLSWAVWDSNSAKSVNNFYPKKQTENSVLEQTLPKTTKPALTNKQEVYVY